MFALIFFQITILFSTAAFAPEEPIFFAPPPEPQTLTQSIQLESGWNLVSLAIFRGSPLEMMTLGEAIPKTDRWFSERHGRVYRGYPMYTNFPNYYPASPNERLRVWELEQSYYIWLNDDYNWKIKGMLPKEFGWKELKLYATRDFGDDLSDPHKKQVAWNLMGYPLLHEMPIEGLTPVDRSANALASLSLFNFIWKDSAEAGLPCRDVRIIKMVDGRILIPFPENPKNRIDEICVFKPGEGYVVGFFDSLGAEYHFDGWDHIKAKTKIPAMESSRPKITSTTHFGFKSKTQWSYPVMIDTVDLNQTPMTAGDEIGIFDGNLCVGAGVFQGSFPLVIPTWKDDFTTPNILDGYLAGHEMAFVWFDASSNSEITFVLPPTVQSSEDDPVAPTHSCFGAGVYALRSMVYGAQSVLQLPTEYKLKQNYPNPFNAVTAIPFELPQRSKVRVELYNVRGQLVTVLFDGIKPAGYEKVVCNARDISSGVYFYRITAEGLEREDKFNSVGKMLLLK